MLDEVLKANNITRDQYRDTYYRLGRFVRRLLVIRYWEAEGYIDHERAVEIEIAEVHRSRARREREVRRKKEREAKRFWAGEARKVDSFKMG